MRVIDCNNKGYWDRDISLGLDSNGGLTKHDELTSEAISFLEELVSTGVLYGSED